MSFNEEKSAITFRMNSCSLAAWICYARGMGMKLQIGWAVVLMGLFTNPLLAWNKRADIAALIQNGALVVDVRSAGEFAGRHFENAVNIPYNLVVNEIRNHVSDKERTIIVYCHSGPRAAVAKRALKSAGYVNVINGISLSRMLRAVESQ